MPERPDRHLLELEREQWRRECRRNLIAFAVEALAPAGQVPAKHHKLICEWLMALVRGELRALEERVSLTSARRTGEEREGRREWREMNRVLQQLMILAPPGSSKTTYVSRLFVAWYLAAIPGAKVISVSHIASLAETNSGYVQRYIRDNAAVLGYSLTNDDKSHWYTDNGGEYLAVGSAARCVASERISLSSTTQSRTGRLRRAKRPAPIYGSITIPICFRG
jgi:hypothetical protein